MNNKYKVDLTKCVSRFTFKERMARFAWSCLLWPCVKYVPSTIGSKLRIVALRAFKAKIGPGCLIERGVEVWIPWRLELTEFVAIGRKVEIYNYDWVRIGGMTVISQYCYLCTGSHDYQSSSFPLIWKPITIGAEVWVAARSLILPGAVIENGAVIAAQSVVSGLIRPWIVCGGNPAKFIKNRVCNA